MFMKNNQCKNIFNICIFFTCLMVLPLINVKALECVTYTQGSGTEEDPYVITTPMELYSIRCNMSSHFVLGNDIAFKSIDFSNSGSFYNAGKYFTPIGTNESNGGFKGVVDGKGHIISGIKTTQENNFIGLFGYNSGIIKNLKLSDFSLEIDNENLENLYIGTIAGYNEGTIEKCENNSQIKYYTNNSENTYIGGIVGYNQGILVDSINDGEMNIITKDSNAFIGGITGFNTNKVSYSKNFANIRTEGLDNNYTVGGIIGKNSYHYNNNAIEIPGEATYLINTGNIFVETNSSATVGGIVGNNDGRYATLYYSYNTGNHKVLRDATNTSGGIGGIAGNNGSGATIGDCYTTGIVEGTNVYKHFIVGYTSSSVKRCYTLYGDVDNKNGSGTFYSIYSLKDIDSPSNTTSYSGFNFNTTWEIKDGNYPLPTLRGLEMISLSENNEEYDGGSGTKTNPYKISTPTHFNNIRLNPYSFFELTNNIVFTEDDYKENGLFYNNGKYFEPIAEFYGELDGNNYVINNLKINNQELDNVGIFSYSDGIIKNVKLNNIEIKSSGKNVGGLVADNDGVINNVSSQKSNIEYTDTIDDNGYNIYVGGLLGTNDSIEVDYVSIDGNISVTSSSNSYSTAVGGIAGNNNGKINYCSNNQVINMTSNSSTLNYLGGIAGTNSNMGGITNCYNSAPISYKNNQYSQSDYIGGIAGTIGSVRTIENCYNIGDIIIESNSNSTFSGEIVGIYSTNSTKPVINTYYLKKDNNINSVFGVALTNEEMLEKTSFTEYNFKTIWTYENFSYKYPVLRSLVIKPKLEQKAQNYIKLKEYNGYEYSLDKTTWQDSNTFENLNPGTKYTLYQRIKATSENSESYTSSVLSVTTLKYNNSNKVNIPIVEGKTDKTISLLKIEGYEYSLDKTTWQDNNIFGNLTPGTKYTLYQRIKETETTYASEISEGLEVSTKKSENTNEVEIPVLEEVTETTIMVTKKIEYEYSIDKVTWQDNSYFKNLTPGTEYTIYQRIKETDSTYASDITELKVKTIALPEAIKVNSIKILGDETISTYKTYQYNVIVLPEDAENKNVTWSLINGTGTATITSSGKLTPKTRGTVTIKAIALDGSGIIAEKEVTILDPAVLDIKLDKTQYELTTNSESLTITPEIITQDDPEYTISWSSSNSNIVSVDNGRISVKDKGGTATVTIKVTVGEKVIEKTINFKVIKEIESIDITGWAHIFSPPALCYDFRVGIEIQMNSKIYPADTNDDKTITWTSSDTSIATVSETGKVRGLKKGTVTITATTSNGKTDSYELNVLDPKVLEIKFDKYNYYAFLGEENIVLKPTIKLQDIEGVSSIRWETNNLEIASVNEYSFDNMLETGTIIAKKPGIISVTIIVDIFGYEYRESVTVDVGYKREDFENLNATIKDNAIIFNSSTTIEELIYNHSLNYAHTLKIYSKDNKITFNGETDFYHNQTFLKTGETISFTDEYGGYKEYKIIIKGDITGDGEIDSLDLASMMNHISEKKCLKGIYIDAAYLNNDEDIDSLDLAYLMNKIAGKEGY